MIKNPPKELDERIVEGNDFFMLSKEYLSQLEFLPSDVLKNMIIKLTEENKNLKKELKNIKASFDNYMATGPRWDNR